MKLFSKIFALIAVGLLCGLLGWLVGATLGGNYAVDFTFNGVRGYEVLGQLGFIGAAIAGGLLCWLIVFKPFKRS